MSLKITHLLKDDPATADELGTHGRIADLIRDEILNSEEGRSIALVGDWGSGKSTIIELLKTEFPKDASALTHLFIYDAWSHQGDSLRRAFLDDFIASLKEHLTEKQATTATDQVWNRAETTITTTEPILRRHAKVLLLSLALIPLGMKLFDLPADKDLVEGLLQPRNALAYLFLIAPVAIIAFFGLINATGWKWIKDFLFGDNHKEKDFSVLSFFFEKVQGRVERKYIKTPVDSIRAFREVFSQIIDDAHERRSELRIIIIIDNIDRIPPDQARDFWSTMQTFFGDGGGLRKPQTRKYWLVTPFSIEALSFLFQDFTSMQEPAPGAQTEARKKAKAYIDKTFGLAFYVPPPILTNWRRYLLGKLETAFPEHAENELMAVRDVYDFARTGSAITPREMKLFVNSLVALYRQRGEDVSLAVMAIYILHRDQIIGTQISDELLSPRERRLIEEADWRVPMAALHFGVGVEDATQLLLQEPMLTALREGSQEKLKVLEGRPGFADVLRRTTAYELEAPDADSGSTIARMAATLGGLESASKPELAGIWQDIRRHLKAAKGWDGLQPSTADGIGAALAHTSGQEKRDVCRAIATSLSNAALADPEGDYQTVNLAGQNWLQAAKAVAEASEAAQRTNIGLPGGPKLKLELLQQLADLDVADEIKAIFKIGATPEEMSNILASDIGAARFPRTQVALVSLLAEKMKFGIQWPVIMNACAERLRVADVGANEAQALVILLLTMNTIGGLANAFDTLKNLSAEGHLSHLLQQHRNTPTRAVIVAAIMLTNPAFERSNQFEQSSAGDAIFNELSGNPASDTPIIKAIADFIELIRAVSLLFEAAAKNQKIAALTATVIAELAASSFKFEIDPKTVLEQRGFLEANAATNPIAPFLKGLSKLNDFLDLLGNEPFEVARVPLYRAALEVADSKSDNSYVNHLKQGILALTKADWEKSLNAADGIYAELLELSGDLQKLKERVELSTPARDAALDQIRKASSGNPPPSDQVRAQLSKILQLLPGSQRTLLMRDVVDDMVGHTDAEQIVQIIETAGDHITLESETDADRIVRRIFSPVVGHPTDRSAAWMTFIVARKPDFFRKMPAETKKEFGWRLRAAIQNKDVWGPAVTEALTNLAGLLEVDLASDEGAYHLPTKEPPE